jgi:hypothetical protein
MATDPDEAAASFFDSAVERFGGWVQYGDTKAGAVLVVLGLGLADLVDAAPDLIHAHRLASSWGDVATGTFVSALAAAALAAVFLGAGVFPHAPAHDPSNDSLLYFRDVAFRTAGEYEREVVNMTLAELNHHRAVEAHGLAIIAGKKANRTRWAFLFAGLFLFFWPLARVALGLAT